MKRSRTVRKSLGAVMVVLGLVGLSWLLQDEPNSNAVKLARPVLKELSRELERQGAQDPVTQSNAPEEPQVQSQEQLTLDPSRPVRCKVLKLYDGDTFGCDINGNGRISRPEEMVRLLGIDSPEMHWSKKNTTGKDLPFAPEAMAYMEQRVMHKMVRLEFDKRRTDRYGRNLAYAYVDEGKASKTSLNEELVRKGLAKLLFLGKNRRYEAQFQQVEEQAKVAKVGIWSLEPAG